MTFDNVEQRGDFLVASKAKEEMVESDVEERHKESYAVYFVVPYKNEEIGNDTFLVEIASHERFAWDAGKRDGISDEYSTFAIRQKNDSANDKLDDLAGVKVGKYYNVADNAQLAKFVNNSDDNVSSIVKTHNEKDYSSEASPLIKRILGPSALYDFERRKAKKVQKRRQEDLAVNMERISKFFTSFIASESVLEKEKQIVEDNKRQLRREKRAELRAELRERIAARIDDSFKKPIEDVVESIKDSKKRRERAKEERKITNSIPTVGRPYE